MSEDLLNDLRDIQLPPAPLLAELPDWGLAGLALGCLAALIGAGFAIRCRLRHPHLRKARRHALRLALTPDTQCLARELSRLLRDYARQCFPERPIAGLSGMEWLHFLDETGGGGEFSRGMGETLASLPYRPPGPSVQVDHAALTALVIRWLEANPR